MQIETTRSGLAQPIVGTAYTVIKATGTEVGRMIEIKGAISDQYSSVGPLINPCFSSTLFHRLHRRAKGLGPTAYWMLIGSFELVCRSWNDIGGHDRLRRHVIRDKLRLKL